MKLLLFGGVATFAAGTENSSVACEDTGGTCALADAAGGVTGMFGSVANYMAGTDAFNCDEWRGLTTCVDSKCVCADGVCAVNGKCGGEVGEITCGGTSDGDPCLFPFMYMNVEYSECTEVDNEGSEWCMVAGGMRWGNCNCQSENCIDEVDFIDEKGFNCTGWEGFYCPSGRMYGYSEIGVGNVLGNCSLTCKVCFPPPPTPGQGDTVSFKVKGSLSFTINDADAANFLSSADSNRALQNALMRIVGDLAEGVSVELVGGGEVEGLTVSCTPSDCPDSVLKLAADLVDACAASSCTVDECCTAFAECDSSVCNNNTHVLKTSPPQTCMGAECWQEECCDFRADCSSINCTTTHVMMDDIPLCADSSCELAECCEPRGICGTTVMAEEDPSTGPSAGPVRDDWSGCPSTSHVSKAVLPALCDAADCTTWECCDVRAVCDVADCDDATHVPKDRDGMLCLGSTCSAGECCELRDTCEVVDCALIEATHVFMGSPSLCMGAECTQPECCEVRASCGVDICTGNHALKGDPNFVCATATCLTEECCVGSYDNYKRTSSYLTVAIADVSIYSLEGAIVACTGDGDCVGITCDIDSYGVAASPCYLRGTQGVEAYGVTPAKVSFVSVLCSESHCTDASHILKTNDLPTTCTSACDQSQCCDPRGQCATDSSRCLPSHVTNGAAADDLCSGATCLLLECCEPRDSCEVSDCNAETHLYKVVHLSLYCSGTECASNGECCDERAVCTLGVCGDTHVLRAAFLRPTRCLGAECTLGECCNPRGTCQENICPTSTHVFRTIETLPWLCLATSCTSDECCLPRDTCSAQACGDMGVLRPLDTRVALCEGYECTFSECCQPRAQCSLDDCASGFRLMEVLPNLCASGTCASNECCEPCPFEGLWQSTNVFGGDALEVFDDAGVMKVRIVSMPVVQFSFEVTDGCRCRIGLDPLTIALGQLSEKGTSISWDMILNNDLWVRPQTRRLDMPTSARHYEVTDGGIVVLGHNRRLSLQDIRVDYEMEANSAEDALAISGILRDADPEDVQSVINEMLVAEGSVLRIGSVYHMSAPQTEQEVVRSNRTLVSWSPISTALGPMVSMMVLGVFFV